MTIDAIKCSVTFATITPESAENGDYEETGFESECIEFDDFADLVSFVESKGFRHASQYPLTAETMNENVWFSTEFEVEDYTTGEKIGYSIHPLNDRTARYLFKAVQAAN